MEIRSPVRRVLIEMEDGSYFEGYPERVSAFEVVIKPIIPVFWRPDEPVYGMHFTVMIVFEGVKFNQGKKGLDDQSGRAWEEPGAAGDFGIVLGKPEEASGGEPDPV